MQKDYIEIAGLKLPLYSVNTLIIGSGAAALKAAVSLVDRGQDDVCIVTDRWGGGTSNNAGSDKQTYYKLSLSGDIPDSPRIMAEDLFNGGSMHGDIALCEAHHSAECFFHLVRLGVPFPHDAFGSYVGYKTDHDPRQRGTSAGPYTSRFMFQALTNEVEHKGIPVLNKHEVITLLVDKANGESSVVGALAFNLNELNDENHGLVVFNTTNIVLGTGGPAGMYKSSVYPISQSGSTGMALRIGAEGHNLTESQFGLASTKFRWNLSGSYQQVIPRYISTDIKGNDEREFLNDFFPDMLILTHAIFLKGYQWPFDPRKIANFGSSLIDLLVYRESIDKGRRVFLDYTCNPRWSGKGEGFSLGKLPSEAHEYLAKSDALLPTPIERLQAMNRPAYELYKEHGIDLEREPIEIAVCNQHNNGGLKGNIWWESNVRHLFPVGEVNGTHGVYRPGGSSLNAGQVGGLRAALYIAKRYREIPPATGHFLKMVENQVKDTVRFIEKKLSTPETDTVTIDAAMTKIRSRMSEHGGIVRNPATINKAVSDALKLYEKLKSGIISESTQSLPAVFKTLDLCLTHAVYLEAIGEYLDRGGRSRGSYLVLNEHGDTPCDDLEDCYRFDLSRVDDFTDSHILELQYHQDGRVNKRWVKVRPIPSGESWFEKAWKDYLKDNVIK